MGNLSRTRSCALPLAPAWVRVRVRHAYGLWCLGVCEATVGFSFKIYAPDDYMYMRCDRYRRRAFICAPARTPLHMPLHVGASQDDRTSMLDAR